MTARTNGAGGVTYYTKSEFGRFHPWEYAITYSYTYTGADSKSHESDHLQSMTTNSVTTSYKYDTSDHLTTADPGSGGTKYT